MKLPFAMTCMNLEGTMISRISQTKTDIVWYHLYAESKKKKKKPNKLVYITKEQTHRYEEQTSGYQWRDRKGEGKSGEGD